MDPSKLKPREGKCLRYVVAKTQQGKGVAPADLVVKIEWSDLPHTALQSKAVLMKLERLGLAKRGPEGFVASSQGIDLMDRAGKQKLWNK